MRQQVRRSAIRRRVYAGIRVVAGGGTGIPELGMWRDLPPHMRNIDFALEGSGWDVPVISSLSEMMREHSDVLSAFSLDYS